MILLDSIPKIEKNKITIIKSWLSNSTMLNILNNCNMDKEFFVKRYAFSFLDYHIQIIKNDLPSNHKNIILDFLKYLKKYDIKTHELFIIYTQFKNAFTNYILELNSQNIDLINEINTLTDKIFVDILKKYNKTVVEFKEALSKSTDIVDKNIIMSRTDLNGVIIKVSSAFCNISAYTKKELIGKSHNILRSSSMPSEVFKDLWRTIQSGKNWHGEIKNQKKDGNFYWVETSIHPNFDNIGKIISYDAISQDITSKKSLESQQNILVEQSKSAAMGEMISMIAHQWRQPLQTVSILIQKLSITKSLDGEISDELLEKVVKDISSQLDYMSKTIDDFRDYFKPNKKKEVVFINNVIHKATEFLGYMFKLDSITLEIHSDENLKVELYLNEIVQVLINIIKNSRDAMIENNIENRVLNITSNCDSNNVYIVIEDNAGGIADDIIGKIFEPYFSTKSNKNGTGLGLYMCKTIVEQHSGGQLLVESHNNCTKFKIVLPLE